MLNGLEHVTDLTRLWWMAARLTSDCQSVMAMRLLGMSGGWHLPRDEHDEMMREKVPAFTEGLVSGALAACAGRKPDRVMLAVLEPISEKARDNRARLAGYGPRIPGPGGPHD